MKTFFKYLTVRKSDGMGFMLHFLVILILEYFHKFKFPEFIFHERVIRFLLIAQIRHLRTVAPLNKKTIEI